MAWLATPHPTHAGPHAGPHADAHTHSLQVTVSGIESAQGTILVALCSPAEFLVRECSHVARAAAAHGEVTVTVADVPAARYALLVLQDLDGDQRLRRSALGMPREPVAFGNDAPMRFGPPSFDAAAVEVGAATRSTRVRLRYR